MRIFVKGQGAVTLSQSHFVAQGGEGSVYARGDTAYKLYADAAQMIPLGKLRELSRIEDDAVIKPEALVVQGRLGRCIGYTMRYVPDAYPLCRLFPRAFRERLGITPEQILALVLKLRQRVESIHRAGVLVVDLNEYNFLVRQQLCDVYAIDVDSYQTPHYPARVIMPSVRDYQAPLGSFSELSDWFSFAVVSFQLFIGIHPYKGRHPQVTGLEQRMRQRLSVFDPAVTMPRICYSLDSIPELYRRWYEAVLARGQRLAPPAGMIATATVKPSPRLFAARSRAVCCQELGDFGARIRSVVCAGGSLLVRTDERLWLDGRRLGRVATMLGRTRAAAVGFTPGGKPALAGLSATGPGGAAAVAVYDVLGRVRLQLAATAEEMMSIDGRIYLRSGDQVLELLLVDVGSRIIASTRIAARILPRATRLYDGVAVQSLLGACYVSLFPAAGESHQLRLTELFGWQVLDAKYDRGVLMLLARQIDQDRRQTLRRLVLRFDGTFGSYDLRPVDVTSYTGLNFVTLDTGVCVCLNEDEQLELCASTMGSTALRLIRDDTLGGDMILSRSAGQVLFFRGSKLFCMTTTGPPSRAGAGRPKASDRLSAIGE